MPLAQTLLASEFHYCPFSSAAEPPKAAQAFKCQGLQKDDSIESILIPSSDTRKRTKSLFTPPRGSLLAPTGFLPSIVCSSIFPFLLPFFNFNLSLQEHQLFLLNWSILCVDAFVHVWMCAYVNMCICHCTSFETVSFLFTMWVPAIKLRSLGLVANTLIYGNNSLCFFWSRMSCNPSWPPTYSTLLRITLAKEDY